MSFAACSGAEDPLERIFLYDEHDNITKKAADGITRPNSFLTKMVSEPAPASSSLLRCSCAAGQEQRTCLHVVLALGLCMQPAEQLILMSQQPRVAYALSSSSNNHVVVHIVCVKLGQLTFA